MLRYFCLLTLHLFWWHCHVRVDNELSELSKNLKIEVLCNTVIKIVKYYFIFILRVKKSRMTLNPYHLETYLVATVNMTSQVVNGFKVSYCNPGLLILMANIFSNDRGYIYNTCALSKHIGNMCMRLRNGGKGEASPSLFPLNTHIYLCTLRQCTCIVFILQF